MRLSSFRIQNFKSIIDTGTCHLSALDNITVLAGQNEAGKSAIIEGLDFFRNGPSDNFDKLHKRRDESPEVECEFILSTEDIENIFIESENEPLKKYLIKNPQIKFTRCLSQEGNLDEIFFTDDTEEKLRLYFPEAVKIDDVVLVSKYSESESEVVSSVPLTPTYEMDDLLVFLINESRNFIFYDSFDDLLPGTITLKEIPLNTAVQDFQQVFNVNFTKIVMSEGRTIPREEMIIKQKASDDLNKYWTQQLEKDSKYNFIVRITRKEPIEESTIEFLIDRADNDPLYLEQKSKGFRWFSAFNLRLRALGVKESTIKNLVILIDEPGQGLHEKAQRDLKEVLEELASKGAQIVYTTHYPNLIGTVGNEFSRIRLVSNTNNTGTKAETVAQFASRPDVGAVDALSPLITAMGIQSIGGLIDSARYNVVVEGITDHYYLSAFQALLNKNDGYSFIPACGVTNVPNLVSVLIGWRLNFKAVFDDDAGSGRKAYNLLKKEFYENSDEQAHEHILKIKDCNGIEDVFSPKDFHKLVLGIELPAGIVAKNSELAKGKKETIARLFLEKSQTGTLVLDPKTKEKVKEIFDWLDLKFAI